MHESSFFDASFVVFIGFLVFMGIALKYGYHKAIGTLDNEIKDIQTTLDHARETLKDAEERAAQARKAEKHLVKEIEDLKVSAEKRIEELRHLTDAEISAQLATKQQTTDITIDMVRHTTILSLREALTEQATEILTNLIASSKSSVQERLNDQAIQQLEQLLSTQQINGNCSPSKQAIA